MLERSWGNHYRNGALVLAAVDGEMVVLVVTEHTGDYHHNFMRVTIANGDDPRRESDHITAKPDEQYYGYKIGPQIGALTIPQMVSLGAGIDVPRLRVEVDAAELLEISRKFYNHRPYRYEPQAATV